LTLLLCAIGAIPDGVRALGERTLLRVQLPEADLGLPGGALVHLLRPLPRLLHQGVPPREQRQERGPRPHQHQRTRPATRPRAHPGGRGPNPQAQDSVSLRADATRRAPPPHPTRDIN